MKGDFTRSTFDPKKHYSRVLMQQGRVQMDADWNEQQELTLDRIETETADVVGVSGGPMHGAGFDISLRSVSTGPSVASVPQQSNLTARAGLTGGKVELVISKGRYYVDGILCENESEVSYEFQPGLTDAKPIKEPGKYLAYLDVWSRHITALDDPQIREVALGGPDTATRAQTVWQVRLVQVDDATVACSKISLPAEASGLLAAHATAAATPSNKPCDVAPGAAFRRLENQLYRVEIHDGGPPGTATFKWSRDNGSIAAGWKRLADDKLTLSNKGRDKVLGFADGQWVELTDDTRELLGQPGTLVQLKRADGEVLTIDRDTATTKPLDLAAFTNNPRVRRWDMNGLLNIPDSSIVWVPLEDGVEVQFSGPGGSTFKTGDYWTIPARTATEDVEWPKDPGSNNAPAAKPPDGIRHHRCNLALLTFSSGVWTRISDCRRIFPPVTELTSFFYVGGDGQEAMPDLTPSTSSADPAGAGGEVSTLRSTLLNSRTKLKYPIEVGVANGQWPVPGATVHFRIVEDLRDGILTGAATGVTGHEVDVPTNEEGIAACEWSLDPSSHSQSVEAHLLQEDGVTPLEIHPIRFNANLSIATRVAYDPKGCGKLAKQTTVQGAIDTLAGLTSLYPVSGDNQSGPPGSPLEQLLIVVASNACGPVAGVRVQFTPGGGGTVTPVGDGTTDGQGMARCNWTLGALGLQTVDAELTPANDPRFVPPTKVRFTANLQSPVADRVFEVTGLFFVTAISGPVQPLRNDMVVSPSKLRNGIQIVFNKDVDSRSFISHIDQTTFINKPVCFVTLEVPFFTQLAGTKTSALVGFQPVILDGIVRFAVVGSPLFDPKTTAQTPGEEILRAATESEDHKILNWIPNTTPLDLNTSDLFIDSIDSLLDLLKGTKKTRLLAKLTLKGNYIWAEGDPERYLDGEAFGDLAGSSIHGIRMPSGDHRSGGDLEVWFWLKKEPVAVRPRIIKFTNTTGTGIQEFTIRNVSDESFNLTSIASSDPAVLVSKITSEKDTTEVLTADSSLSAREAINPQLGGGPSSPITIIQPGQFVTVEVTFSCGAIGSHNGKLTINRDGNVEAEVEFEGTCQQRSALPAADSVDKNTRKKMASPKKKPVAKKKRKPKQ